MVLWSPVAGMEQNLVFPLKHVREDAHPLLKLLILEAFLCILLSSHFVLKQMEIYSLTLSRIDTACHNEVLTYEGMLGSCVKSSN